MKEALKSYKVYIVAGILTILGYIPFIVAVFMSIFSTSTFDSYVYVEWTIMAVYILIGFVWGDQHNASWQRKNKKYDEQAPSDVKVESWKRRLPFFIGALIIAILCIVLEIIALTMYNGVMYPFQG